MTTNHPQKITFGEMRACGVRDVLVYCRDHHCSHHVVINADRWPDGVRLSAGFGSRVRCFTRNGHDWPTAFRPSLMLMLRHGGAGDVGGVSYRRAGTPQTRNVGGLPKSMPSPSR